MGSVGKQMVPSKQPRRGRDFHMKNLQIPLHSDKHACMMMLSDNHMGTHTQTGSRTGAADESECGNLSLKPWLNRLNPKLKMANRSFLVRSRDERAVFIPFDLHPGDFTRDKGMASCGVEGRRAAAGRSPIPSQRCHEQQREEERNNVRVRDSR